MNNSLKAPLPARLTVTGLVLLLAMPIVITLVYSFSAQWGAHILPSGFTLDWYLSLWSDSRFRCGAAANCPAVRDWRVAG